MRQWRCSQAVPDREILAWRANRRVAIAHHLELEMVPGDYQPRVNPFLKLSPDKRFKFRVRRHRYPFV